MTTQHCVLIIDDCPDDHEQFRLYLEQKGQQQFKIIQAVSGFEGWKICLAERPDCILLDYYLPDIDGLEFLSLIKEHGLQGIIPILICTRQEDVMVASQALKHGATDYLLKSRMTANGLCQAASKAIEEARLFRKTEARRQEIARSQQELQQFAHIVSHDLQGPTRRIITFLEMLQKDSKERMSARSQDLLKRSQKGALRMSQLIESLLRYSLVGGTENAFVPVNLETIVQEVLSELADQIPQDQVTVNVGVLSSIVGIPTLLYQLFQNLLTNAVRYQSIRPLTLKISASHVDNNLLIQVEDNGMGISSEHFEKIFQLFKRLDPSSCPHGSGIGLALCKKIVELHGGRIWVESTADEGSTFSFTLPLSAQESKNHIEMNRTNIPILEAS